MAKKNNALSTNAKLIILSIFLFVVTVGISTSVAIVYFSKKENQENLILSKLVDSNLEFKRDLKAKDSQLSRATRAISKRKTECNHNGDTTITIDFQNYSSESIDAINQYYKVRSKYEKILKKYNQKDFYVSNLHFRINENRMGARTKEERKNLDKIRFNLSGDARLNFKKIDVASEVYKELLNAGFKASINGRETKHGACYDE